MDEVVKQIAEKLGIDEERASGIADVLHGDGHNLQELLQDGDFLGKAHQLLGPQGQHLLNGIPGMGGLLSGLFGGDDPPTGDHETSAPEDPGT